MISLVMVVKNEEVNLPLCVNSFDEIFDEFVLLDTGSVDDTKKVALELGARIFDYPHKDEVMNFSNWRNYAKEQAEGDWIITVDADEWVADGCAAKLKQEIINASDSVDLINVHSYVISNRNDVTKIPKMIQYVSKAFRNKKEIKWIGERHNILSVASNRTKKCSQIVFYHCHSVRDRKFSEERDKGRVSNIDFFLQKIDENPNDLRSRFYLANHLKETGDFSQAIEHYIEYLNKSLWSDERCQAGIYLANCFLKTNEPVKAKKVLAQALIDNPGRAEVCVKIGIILQNEKKFEEAIQFFNFALSCDFPDSLLFLTPASYTWEPCEHLSYCYFRLGKHEKSIDNGLEALKYQPEQRRIRKNLSISFAASDSFTTAEKELSEQQIDVVIGLELESVLIFGGISDEKISLFFQHEIDIFVLKRGKIRGSAKPNSDTGTPLWIPEKRFKNYELIVYSPGLFDNVDDFLVEVCYSEAYLSSPKKIIVFTENIERHTRILSKIGFDVVENDGYLICERRHNEPNKIKQKTPDFMLPVNEVDVEVKTGTDDILVKTVISTTDNSNNILVIGNPNILSSKFSNAVFADFVDHGNNIVLEKTWLPFRENQFDVVYADFDSFDKELILKFGTFGKDGLRHMLLPDKKVVKENTITDVFSPKFTKKSIIIYFGPCWHSFNSLSIKNGSYLRGSSKSCIYLAEELVKKDWDVTVFGQTETYDSDTGVKWRNFSTFSEDIRTPDVFLSYRRPKITFKDSFNVFYGHDAGMYGRVSLDKFNLVLAVSKWMATRLSERYGVGNRIEVLNNGLNFDLIEKVKLDVQEKDRNLLFHHFAVDRSLPALLQIFPKIRERVDRDLRLVVSGNFGDWEKECNKRNGYGLDLVNECQTAVEEVDGVDYIGPNGEEFVFRQLSRAYLCLYPCNVRESFCMSAVEAKAFGTPLITSRISALDETAVPGSILVSADFPQGHEKPDRKKGTYDPKYQENFVDVCVKLLDDDRHWENLSFSGMEDAKNYSWDKIADRFIEVTGKAMSDK